VKATFDERFAAAIEKHRRTPFRWGVSDCVTLALDAVHARTGKWLVKRTWKSEAGARAALAVMGFADVEEAVAAHLTEIPVIQSRRADIGIVESELGKACVVCIGDRWFGKSPQGPLLLPLRFPRRAFRAWARAG
jgi:hypothetical protein